MKNIIPWDIKNINTKKNPFKLRLETKSEKWLERIKSISRFVVRNAVKKQTEKIYLAIILMDMKNRLMSYGYAEFVMQENIFPFIS